MLTYERYQKRRENTKPDYFVCQSQGAHGIIETRASKLLREAAKGPGSLHVMSCSHKGLLCSEIGN